MNYSKREKKNEMDKLMEQLRIQEPNLEINLNGTVVLLFLWCC